MSGLVHGPHNVAHVREHSRLISVHQLQFLILFMSLATSEDISPSDLSLSSSSSTEDWDRSDSEIKVKRTTPRNSVFFPRNGEEEQTPNRAEGGHSGKRTISELLKVYAEKGTDVQFSQEEATRVAEVLGNWVRCKELAFKGRISHLFR